MTGNKIGDRILTLDTMRGVAVLGILLLNIIAFSMPTPAYFNPAAYGGDSGADLGIWLLNFILFDGRMRGLFSFLFGASMLLVIDRARARGENAARVHYARMLWLLVFGLIHLWLIWWGDILCQYALIGMIAFAFRNARIQQMVAAGVTLLLMQMIVIGTIPAIIVGAQGAPGDADAQQTLKLMSYIFGTPTDGWITEQVALHRGGWLGIAIDRFADTQFQPLAAVYQYGWETLAYMLFGMAALRDGMLTGEWPRRRYLKWIAIGFGVGIPAYAVVAAYMISQDFSLFSVATATMPVLVPFRPLVIMAWASLIVLAVRPGGILTMRLAAAGRMAFTNYLATSLICTTIFYGYGFGWYGALSRAEVYIVVLAVWALILLWSKPWLDRFAYGPLEWLWRSLSRAERQPMVRAAKPAFANHMQ